MSGEQACYTLIAKDPAASKNFTEKQIKTDLEGANIPAKIAALKEVIRCLANGERIKDLLMTVIRFVMPCPDHTIKKLLLLFWEIVPKYGSDGKLLHEMILVCDAYRKDLQHPNEYIRGCTLRFLCKLKEPELLEPLVPTIKQCLDHRHAYVRRNAVLAIFTIYKNFDFLFPDAPTMILKFLEEERDASCKRNAFIMLTHADQATALEYLATCLDEVPDFDEILQLVIVELIYKVCHTNPAERARFIRCVYGLLQSKSPSVRYEAAGTLVTLSNAPTAVKAVASCYIDLILKESDNNVKLIVMDRLIALRSNNERIIQDMVMDVIQILSSSDMELRTKTLDFVLDLVTNRTVEELTNLLIKELLRACATSAAASTQQASKESSDNTSDDARYRFALVHIIYEIAMRFPTILQTVIPAVCEVITYEEIDDTNTCAEVSRFLRESIKRHPTSKSLILEHLTQVFANITGKETLRHALWIFGEFSTSKEEINTFLNLVRESIGELPLVDNELRRLSGEADPELKDTADAAGVEHNNKSQDGKSAPKVTADGSYASQSVFVSKDSKNSKAVERPVLQAALFDSDFLPGVILSVGLVKLFSRYQHIVRSESGAQAAQKENAFASECLLIISSMIHLAKSNLLEQQINPDLIDRIWKCFR
ncbi:Coatomer subunit beta, partial [Cichlidogyrus casuarinus]